MYIVFVSSFVFKLIFITKKIVVQNLTSLKSIQFSSSHFKHQERARKDMVGLGRYLDLVFTNHLLWNTYYVQKCKGMHSETLGTILSPLDALENKHHQLFIPLPDIKRSIYMK